MSRILARVVDFFDPKPSQPFAQRMEKSRNQAEREANKAIKETEHIRAMKLETMYDRLVIDRPARKRQGDRHD